MQAQTQGQLPVPAQRQTQRHGQYGRALVYGLPKLQAQGQLHEQVLALAYGLPKLQAQGQLHEQVRALAPCTGKSVGAVPGSAMVAAPGKVSMWPVNMRLRAMLTVLKGPW